MYLLKMPREIKNSDQGIDGHNHRHVVMNVIGEFQTVQEAIAEADRLGLDGDRAMIDSQWDNGDQLSVNQWRELKCRIL
jgi:hypothetical protein